MLYKNAISFFQNKSHNEEIVNDSSFPVQKRFLFKIKAMLLEIVLYLRP